MAFIGLVLYKCVGLLKFKLSIQIIVQARTHIIYCIQLYKEYFE